MKKSILLLSAALILAGCASGVTRNAQLNQSPTANTQKVSKDNPISSVNLSLSEEAKAKALDNTGFSQDKLLESLKNNLAKNELFSDRSKNLSLNVVVNDMRVRSTLSAVVLGFLAGNDSLSGEAQLNDKNGAEVDKFGVSASYAMGGAVGGLSDVRTGWLYNAFSEEIVNELTGKK